MTTMFRTLLCCSVGAWMLAGCAATAPRAARLSEDVRPGDDAKATAALADQIRRVLAQRDGESAVALAERLVAARPHEAGYRALLGQSYLQAGRFASARQAFTDALQLDPADGRSALNLALAMIAGGQGAGARVLLVRHSQGIPAADLGLALALTGAPDEGIRILTAATREPGASVRTRQNLALALALAGQWDAARMAASADMTAVEVDIRMREWADFAGNTHPADRIAALLGIKPSVDTGQPVILALNAAPSAAVVEDMAHALSIPTAPGPAAPGPATPAAVILAARQEVVQPLSLVASERSPSRGRAPRLASGPVTAPVLLRRAEERRAIAHHAGDWNVQLGAFGQADGAQKAWLQLTRRFRGLLGHAPQSGTVRHAGAQLHRLSVGGFSRAQADALCRRYRAAGGACFVRREADDRMAQWARPGIATTAI